MYLYFNSKTKEGHIKLYFTLFLRPGCMAIQMGFFPLSNKTVTEQ